MKRSEMVEEIALRLGTMIDLSNQEMLVKEANWLLDQIQKLGMKPPGYSKTVHRENSAGQYLSSTTISSDNWEPEDDTSN